MPDAVQEAIFAATREVMGGEPVGLRHTVGGHTSAMRAVVDLKDGSSVFVKVAADEQTATWLIAEHRIYDHVHAPFMPKMLGWRGGMHPVLVLEDLSALHQPPPWDGSDMNLALKALDQLAHVTPPSGLARLGDRQAIFAARWDWAVKNVDTVAKLDIAPRQALPGLLAKLRERAARAQVGGQALVHLDVRADNMFFRDDQAVILDWNWATVGNPLIDRVLFAIRAEAQGAPAAHLCVPGQAAVDMAAMVGGMWVETLAAGTDASAARQALQRQCLEVAVRWASA